MEHVTELVEEVRKGSVRALARLITLIENEQPRALHAMKSIWPHTGNAYIIGITGPPGAGKSTLVDRITMELRNREKSVGIVAIDPTSSFTGGALLGDRVRMQEVSTDEDVFIRSMATRGSLGGLSRATSDTVKLLDASGKDYVIVETVGVGQDEVEIVRTADVSIVVVIPGSGDDIQAIKAGIMEIADIFVVNKSDKEGADRLATEIKMMLELSSAPKEWSPKIIKTIATENQGIDTLVEKVKEHLEFLLRNGILAERRKERTRYEVVKMIEHETFKNLEELITSNKDLFDHRLENIVNRNEDPYLLAKQVLITISKKMSKKCETA